jgi:hypothetical protein
MGLAAAHRHHADPVNLSAQSDPLGAPEPMSIVAVLAAPNGGYLRVRCDAGARRRQEVDLHAPTRPPDPVCPVPGQGTVPALTQFR